MSLLQIFLETEYTSVPAEIKVYCNNKKLYNGFIKSQIKITHNLKSSKGISIKILKTGRTEIIAKKGHKQIVFIKKIKLNGIDLKINAFGNFIAKDNFYTSEQKLQTTELAFNGVWTIKINDTYNIPGLITDKGRNLLKNFIHSNIACFGASNTYRNTTTEGFKIGLWPEYINKYTKLQVKNYGVGGSSLSEITCLVKKYSEKFTKCNIIIFAPHTFRFQTKKNKKLINSLDFSLLDKNVVLHGEEHYIAILSNKLQILFDKISKNNNVYFCSDNKSEYDLFWKTPLKKYMIPNVKFKYKQDNNMHFEEKFHSAFAKKIIKHIGIK